MPAAGSNPKTCSSPNTPGHCCTVSWIVSRCGEATMSASKSCPTTLLDMFTCHASKMPMYCLPLYAMAFNRRCGSEKPSPTRMVGMPKRAATSASKQRLPQHRWRQMQFLRRLYHSQNQKYDQRQQYPIHRVKIGHYLPSSSAMELWVYRYRNCPSPQS